MSSAPLMQLTRVTDPPPSGPTRIVAPVGADDPSWYASSVFPMAPNDSGGGAGGNSPILGLERKKDRLIGSVINGKFHIKQAIARGGMGRIYLATQVPVDRPVALKVVQADTENEEESQFLKRFLQEASILAKLQHPNVVTLFDYGRIEGSPIEMYFIAMEYLAGETLTQRFRARMLSTAEVLSVFRQIARGLREAHARGVVHRDLKPSNIILVPEAEGEIVKLVDFGIGKVMTREGADDLTQDGVMVGTPKYMAPEQFEGTASTASDIYALGTIVYQALTGALPFGGNTLAEFMVAKLAHPVPPMRELNPNIEVTEALESLVLSMLERRPEDRPTLEEVFMHLGTVEEEVFGTASGARPHLRMTGSGPISRQAVPSSQRPLEELKVPETVVQPVPMSMGTFTPRPMASSNRPPPENKTKNIVAAGSILIAVSFLLLGGVGVWWAKSRADERAKTVASAAPTATPLPAPSEAPASFTLTVESSPEGATVLEDDKPLGTTPFQIAIDRASVKDKPRTLIVKKDGFVAATVVQGATNDPTVKTMVSLAPEPSAPVKSHAQKPATKPPAGGGAPPNDLDIRLKR